MAATPSPHRFPHGTNIQVVVANFGSTPPPPGNEFHVFRNISEDGLKDVVAAVHARAAFLRGGKSTGSSVEPFFHERVRHRSLHWCKGRYQEMLHLTDDSNWQGDFSPSFLALVTIPPRHDTSAHGISELEEHLGEPFRWGKRDGTIAFRVIWVPDTKRRQFVPTKLPATPEELALVGGGTVAAAAAKTLFVAATNWQKGGSCDPMTAAQQLYEEALLLGLPLRRGVECIALYAFVLGEVVSFVRWMTEFE